MPCDSRDRIDSCIRSDRKTVKTCVVLYPVVGVFTILAALFPRLWTNTAIASIPGSLISLLAIPLVFQHIRRSGALVILQELRDECDKYAEDNPKCQGISVTVEKILLDRAGVNAK